MSESASSQHRHDLDALALANKPSNLIDAVRFRNFTAFESLDFNASPGINVLIGENATGKTHLMKAAYAACDASTSQRRFYFTEKLTKVFLPSGGRLGRMVKRKQGSSTSTVSIDSGGKTLYARFSNHATNPDSHKITVRGATEWGRKYSKRPRIKSVYIPPKEMLANAPGFRSLYAERAIHFEEVYRDILDKAYLPYILGKPDSDRRKLLGILNGAMRGRIFAEGEEFFHSSNQGKIELSLLAEGLRKIGLLSLLVRNGTLGPKCVLFWDEPETNLNPKLFKPVIAFLLQLQRLGSQIFIATHDYVILKELDLQKQPDDSIAFHSLYREQSGKSRGEISVHSTDRYLDINPNAIADTFDDLYDRDVDRSLASFKE